MTPAMIERFDKYLPLFDAFAASGHTLYLVGGCVRDVVMGLDAVGDVDLATDALPDETKKTLARAGFKAFPIGEKFGTITTLVGDVPVEITTLRVGEVYEPGSRHPRVEFGTSIEADLSRRDLSLNAMAMGRDGVIIDPFGGHRAIREGVLEVPGGGYENTLSILRDDPLRLLRIGRFSARFGFAPSAETTRAAIEVASELRHISRERWRTEMEKTLLEPALESGICWLHQVGALAEILPVAASASASDVLGVCERLAVTERDAISRWAVLLLTLASIDPSAPSLPELAEQVSREFRFSKKERRAIGYRVSLPDTADGETTGAPELRRFYADSPTDAFSRLSVASAMAKTDAERDSVRGFHDALTALLGSEDPVPKLPSGLGRALAKEFALQGTEIGAAMSHLREAIFDGVIENNGTKDAYLAFWRTHLETEHS